MLIQKLFTAAVSVAFSVTAFAQTTSTEREPAPEAPKLEPADASAIQHQAGIGSNVSYARGGVVELGGSISATSADKYTSIGLAPSVGYFLVDNVQLTGIVNWRYAKVEDADAQHVTTVIAEPSFHVPLNNYQFIFAGVGIGMLFQTDVESGAAFAPRLGLKNLVGRSGMLTADVQAIYGLNRSEVRTAEGTVLAVKSAYGLSVGYTVLL